LLLPTFGALLLFVGCVYFTLPIHVYGYVVTVWLRVARFTFALCIYVTFVVTHVRLHVVTLLICVGFPADCGYVYVVCSLYVTLVGFTFAGYRFILLVVVVTLRLLLRLLRLVDLLRCTRLRYVVALRFVVRCCALLLPVVARWLFGCRYVVIYVCLILPALRCVAVAFVTRLFTVTCPLTFDLRVVVAGLRCLLRLLRLRLPVYLRCVVTFVTLLLLLLLRLRCYVGVSLPTVVRCCLYALLICLILRLVVVVGYVYALPCCCVYVVTFVYVHVDLYVLRLLHLRCRLLRYTRYVAVVGCCCYVALPLIWLLRCVYTFARLLRLRCV